MISLDMKTESVNATQIDNREYFNWARERVKNSDGKFTVREIRSNPLARILDPNI